MSDERSVPARARARKKSDIVTPDPVALDARRTKAAQALDRRWRRHGAELSIDALEQVPLTVLLMHGLAFEDGSPLASILRSVRSRLDDWITMALSASDMKPTTVELTPEALHALRRVVDVAIELDRRTRGAS